MLVNLNISVLHLYAAFVLASFNPDDREISPKPEAISGQVADASTTPLPERRIVKDFSIFSELKDTEILNLVSGKRLSNTPDGEFVGRLFVEDFNHSGSWTNNFNDRPPMKLRGTWNVKGGKLCVVTTKIPEKCRSVYIDRIAGEIWMSEFNSRLPHHLHQIFLIDRAA
jgi:hypothetical protein